MATTSNFGWTTPDDTDLVKDGAAAIRTALGGVDTSFVDLKGGTTGQVLAKASNTDLDYTWSNVDPLTILDAKGDLITATAADTPSRLGVGSNNQVLTADSSTATGLKWATPTAGAYTLLASGSLSGTETSITGIPSGYSSLRLLIVNPKASTNGFIRFRINSNTSSNYSINVSKVQTATNSVTTSASEWNIDTIAESINTFGRIIFDLPGYASTEWHGMLFYTQMGTTTMNEVSNGKGAYYANDTAITSVQIRLNGTQTFTGGTYQVYGEN
jgi:hypothetical protein